MTHLAWSDSGKGMTPPLFTILLYRPLPELTAGTVRIPHGGPVGKGPGAYLPWERGPKDGRSHSVFLCQAGSVPSLSGKEAAGSKLLGSVCGSCHVGMGQSKEIDMNIKIS